MITVNSLLKPSLKD